MQVLAAIIVALIPLLIILFAIQVWFSWRFLQKLSTEYEDTWKILGKPSMFLGASISNQKNVRAFIKTKAYLELNDEEINRICAFMTKMSPLYLVIFLLIVVCFLSLVFLKNST